MIKEKINKISKSINYATKQIDIITHSRLFVAIFMITDGIDYIRKQNKSFISMTKGVGMAIFLASCALILANIKNKKYHLKYNIFPIIFIIASAFIYLYPNYFYINIRILLSIFIILNALINIFNIHKLDKLSASITYAENKLKDDFNNGEKAKSYNKKSILKKISKLLDPFNNFIEKTNGHYHLYMLLNNISIILGILLLTKDNLTIIVCGLIFIYTGVFDLFMFLRSVRLARKNNEIKDKGFKSLVNQLIEPKE